LRVSLPQSSSNGKPANRLNLGKAYIDYDNPALRDEDIVKAKAWAKRSKLTRKENEEKRAAQHD
jgi:hypothetical protein